MTRWRIWIKDNDPPGHSMIYDHGPNYQGYDGIVAKGIAAGLRRRTGKKFYARAFKPKESK